MRRREGVELMMQKKIKNYKNSVAKCLEKKYGLSEFEANKIIKSSFLPESLENFPEDTLHDDIETTADEVYYDYTHPILKRM